jgi:hypothetical protein
MVKGLTRSRRLFLVTGALAVLGAALLAQPATGQEHDGPMPDPAPGILPPGDWTPQQVDFAVSLVHRTEAVLPAKFGDVSKLPDLGYHNLGVTVPGGYDHWGLPLSAGGDGRVLDPELPESLVFQHLPDGQQVLVSALFVLDPGLTMADVPPEYAWLPGWHTHVNETCLDDNSVLVGTPVNGVCARGHQVQEPMLHVWITDNACGHRFAGLGSKGLMCDDHIAPPPPAPGSTVPTVSTTSVPPPAPASTSTSTSRPTGPTTTVAPASPSTAVQATPNYAG